MEDCVEKYNNVSVGIKYDIIIVKICNFNIIAEILENAEDTIHKMIHDCIIEDHPYVKIIKNSNNIISIIYQNKDNTDIEKLLIQIYKKIQVTYLKSADNLGIYLHLLIINTAVTQYNKINEAINFLITQFSAIFYYINDGKYYYIIPDLENYKMGKKDEMYIAQSFHKEVNNKKLQLVFQPVVCVTNNNTSYYEALLRIKKHTLISVGPFITTAERLGFIDEIDNTVLKLVCEELEKTPNLTLSFNVSNVAIGETTWLKQLEQNLKKYPTIGKRMIVEFTETSIQNNLAHTAYFIAYIQSLGCKVAIDDFGAGFTSLNQLRTLSVDIVKIDGSYIKNIAERVENKILVKAIISICKEFNIKTVAEFVEDGCSAKTLIDLGIDYLQGYYFSPPLDKPL